MAQARAALARDGDAAEDHRLRRRADRGRAHGPPWLGECGIRHAARPYRLHAAAAAASPPRRRCAGLLAEHERRQGELGRPAPLGETDVSPCGFGAKFAAACGCEFALVEALATEIVEPALDEEAVGLAAAVGAERDAHAGIGHALQVALVGLEHALEQGFGATVPQAPCNRAQN